MNKNNFKWWCEDMSCIHAVLNRDRDKGYSIDECDVLAVLEYPRVDIELTVRGIDEKDNLIYDYYCCVNYAKDSKEDGWESYDWVDFGEVDPKEFTTEKELMEDMNKQLIKFCEKRDLEMEF